MNRNSHHQLVRSGLQADLNENRRTKSFCGKDQVKAVPGNSKSKGASLPCTVLTVIDQGQIQVISDKNRKRHRTVVRNKETCKFNRVNKNGGTRSNTETEIVKTYLEPQNKSSYIMENNILQKRHEIQPNNNGIVDGTDADTRMDNKGSLKPMVAADYGSWNRLPSSKRALLIPVEDNSALSTNEKGADEPNEAEDCLRKQKQMSSTNVENMMPVKLARSEDTKVNTVIDKESGSEDLYVSRPDEKLFVAMDNRISEESGYHGDGEETRPKMLLMLDRNKTEETDAATGSIDKSADPEMADEDQKYKPEIKDETNFGNNLKYEIRDNVKERATPEKEHRQLEKEKLDLETGSNDLDENRCGIESSWISSESFSGHSSYFPSLTPIQSDLPYKSVGDGSYRLLKCSRGIQWERQIGPQRCTVDAGYKPGYVSMEDVAFYSLGGTSPQKYTSMLSNAIETEVEVENVFNKGGRYESLKEKGQLENDSEKDECEDKFQEQIEYDNSVTMESRDDIEVTRKSEEDIQSIAEDLKVSAVETRDTLVTMTIADDVPMFNDDNTLIIKLEDSEADFDSGADMGMFEGQCSVNMFEGHHHGDKVMKNAEMGIRKLRVLLELMESYPECGVEEVSCMPDKPLSPEVPVPRLPSHGHNDLPDKGDHGGRRITWLCGEFGRQHSDGITSGRGNSNPINTHRGSDDDNSGGRRNDNDDHGNNSRRHQGNGENSRDDNNNDSNGNSNSRNPARSPEMVTQPAQDFKRFRKKQHCGMSVEEWAMVLGELALKAEGPVWWLETDSMLVCVTACLDRPDYLTDDMITCYVCISVNSLLKHFANCSSPYNTCSMCVQIFSLICMHVHNCTHNNVQCEISLCQKISVQLGGRPIAQHIQRLWYKVRKNLARIIGDSEESLTYTALPRPERSSVTSIGSFTPSLISIPETGTVPDSVPEAGSRSRGGSRVQARKKSNLMNVEECEPTTDKFSDSQAQIVESADQVQPIYSRSDESKAKFLVPHRQDVDVAPITPIALDVVQPAIRPWSPGAQSMPLGITRPVLQYPSLGDRPIGIKGIGEVVYADKQQLVLVAKYWAGLRRQYSVDQALPQHLREEGVILDEMVDRLLINKTRYSIDYQWVKVSHLGNGMSGKCHLATDFDTDFKFCVKEMHISKYELEEVELWSELDHPNIVQMYGAIRHGEKIYILQEFIDGGCLTEAINCQRTLQRRLSHKTALHYFRQLLQVLVYLKSKHMLNEDIKADNLLLCREGTNSSNMKVADFGLARRCDLQVRKGTPPVGTQTQWSPEKAESEEYGFSAELWAAVCVLVHMLSGYPPWIRRFANFRSLIVVIVDHSPPLEDIPSNISKPVRDLIERGFTVCPGQRPIAEQLLLHTAFLILDDDGPRDFTAVSMLPPSIGTDPGNQLPEKDEENADLIKILQALKNNPEKPEFIQPQSISSQIVPPVTVNPQENVGPHIEQFIDDELTKVCPPPDELEEYHPDQPGHDTPINSIEENIDVNERLLPKFDIILPDLLSFEDEKEPVVIPIMVNSSGSSPDSKTETELEVDKRPQRYLLDDDKYTSINEDDLFVSGSPELKDHSSPGLPQSSANTYQPNTENMRLPQIVTTQPYPGIGNNPLIYQRFANTGNVNQYRQEPITDSTNPTNQGNLQFYPNRNPNLRPNSTGSQHFSPADVPSIHPQRSASTPGMSNSRDSPQSDVDKRVPHSTPNFSTMSPSARLPPATTAYTLASYLPTTSQENRNMMPSVFPNNNNQDHFLFPPTGNQFDTARFNRNTNTQTTKSSSMSVSTGHKTTPLPSQHSSPVLHSTNITTSDNSSPVDEQGFKRDKDRVNEQLRSYMESKPLEDLPVIVSMNTINRSVTTVPEPTGKPRLNIKITQVQPLTTQALTAPVTSPPQPGPGLGLERSVSMAVTHTPGLVHNRPGSQPSTSTPKSQYDVQEDLLNEFKNTAEDALSQHSESSHLLLLQDEDEDDFDPANDSYPHTEFHLSSGEVDPAESLAPYLTNTDTDGSSFKVVFRSRLNDVEISMKFSGKDKTRSWLNVIECELCRSPEINKTFGCERFQLKHEDGSVVDLQSELGSRALTVYVHPTTDNDIWWVEGGMINH